MFILITGRGQKSHAYTHSVQEGHHVFLNLATHKFYCLPDNYQIIDQSLEDIVVRETTSICLWVCLAVLGYGSVLIQGIYSAH